MLGLLKSALPPYVLWPWSSGFVPSQRSTEMDERAGDAANWKPRSWPFVLFFRQGLFWKADIKRKIQPVMSWNWTKCDEAYMKKNERKKRAFLYQKGLCSENCLKLQHFPHLVHSRKLCIVPRTKTFFAPCYEEKLRQMQMAQKWIVW